MVQHKQLLVSTYPLDNPIVNATQETLPDVLAELLTDGRRRRQLGQQGHACVEAHHDSLKIASQLGSIYEELIAHHASLI